MDSRKQVTFVDSVTRAPISEIVCFIDYLDGSMETLITSVCGVVGIKSGVKSITLNHYYYPKQVLNLEGRKLSSFIPVYEEFDEIPDSIKIMVHKFSDDLEENRKSRNSTLVWVSVFCAAYIVTYIAGCVFAFP